MHRPSAFFYPKELIHKECDYLNFLHWLASLYDGYVEFLCDLRIRYDDHRRQQSSGANRRITANELHKRWMRDGIG